MQQLHRLAPRDIQPVHEEAGRCKRLLDCQP